MGQLSIKSKYFNSEILEAYVKRMTENYINYYLNGIMTLMQILVIVCAIKNCVILKDINWY